MSLNDLAKITKTKTLIAKSEGKPYDFTNDEGERIHGVKRQIALHDGDFNTLPTIVDIKDIRVDGVVVRSQSEIWDSVPAEAGSVEIIEALVPGKDRNGKDAYLPLIAAMKVGK